MRDENNNNNSSGRQQESDNEWAIDCAVELQESFRIMLSSVLSAFGSLASTCDVLNWLRLYTLVCMFVAVLFLICSHSVSFCLYVCMCVDKNLAEAGNKSTITQA